MDILENGLDSLKKCILNLYNKEKCAEKDYEFLLKDIIIDFHHSIETIFKYLVIKQNEFLIYDNLSEIFKGKVENEFRSAPKSLSQKTIEFLDAVNRVVILYKIKISEVDYNKFKLLNEFRNSLTHSSLEFKENEVEHLISLLLPILLPIYKKYITEFDAFVKMNNLTERITEMQNIDFWILRSIIDFYLRWKKAKEKIDHLEMNPHEKEAIYKNKDRDLIECPLCKNQLFLATGNYILSSENIEYTGECYYCNIAINRNDKQLISFLYGGRVETFLQNYNDDIFSSLENLLIEDDPDKETMNYIKSNIQLLYEFIKRGIHYRIDELCETLAYNYFHIKKYDLNDVMESLIEEQDSEISISFTELIKYYSPEDLDFSKLINLKTMSEKIIKLSPKVGQEMKRNISRIYVSYFDGMYIDSEGEEKESDISIKVDLEYEDLISFIDDNDESYDE